MDFLKTQIVFFKTIQSDIFNVVIDKESIAYDACTYTINTHKIISRKSKITPKKIGQFVTIWKRNKDQITTPYTQEDDFDYLIILCKSEEKKGLFIFPKEILAKKNIISSQKKEGKRGIRIYPSWDTPTSNLALKTQEWQLQYFIKLPVSKVKQEYYRQLFK